LDFGWEEEVMPIGGGGSNLGGGALGRGGFRPTVPQSNSPQIFGSSGVDPFNRGFSPALWQGYGVDLTKVGNYRNPYQWYLGNQQSILDNYNSTMRPENSNTTLGGFLHNWFPQVQTWKPPTQNPYPPANQFGGGVNSGYSVGDSQQPPTYDKPPFSNGGLDNTTYTQLPNTPPPVVPPVNPPSDPGFGSGKTFDPRGSSGFRGGFPGMNSSLPNNGVISGFRQNYVNPDQWRKW
jgi:hypothetical protein